MATLSDDLDSVVTEIEQGCMQRGGFRELRCLLKKLVEEIEEKNYEHEKQLVQILERARKMYCEWCDTDMPRIDGGAMAYELVKCREALTKTKDRGHDAAEGAA